MLCQIGASPSLAQGVVRAAASVTRRTSGLRVDFLRACVTRACRYTGAFMGTQDVQADLTAEQRSDFMKALLRDTRALERLLETNAFESDVRRIGAEQEMVLVDHNWQPAPLAMALLDGPDRITDPRLTTEIARFNVEANLTPRVFTGSCLRDMETEINECIQIVREACRRHGAEVVLTGILPTLDKTHLGRENISDRPRYFELDKALRKLRGGAYELNDRGTRRSRYRTRLRHARVAEHVVPAALPGERRRIRARRTTSPRPSRDPCLPRA